MPDNLQFERAEQTGTPSCSVCKSALSDQYYVVNGHVVCDRCRRAVAEEWVQGGAGRVGKAIGLGVLATIACSVAWYLVLKLTGSEFGILAIVVGFVVGGAVRKGSNGRGGWRYQALAIFLTYTAIVSSYVPYLVDRERPAETVVLLYSLPFLMGFQNLIGLLIIGIALFEAWKLNVRSELSVSGPHRVSTNSAPG